MNPAAGLEEGRSSLRELLAFPLTDADWAGKATIGGLLILGSPLLVPDLLVLGYLVEVTRRTAKTRPASLPSWRPLGLRVRDGWRLALLGLALGWPAFLATATLAVGPLIFGGPLEGSPVAGLLASVALVLQPLGVLWGLAMVLLAPALLAQVAAGSASPMAALRLARARATWLVRLWPRQLALLLLSLSGILVAGVGLAFTLFWALLGIAHLAAEVGRPNGRD